ALHHPLQQVGVVTVPFRKVRTLIGDLQQQSQPVRLIEGKELVPDLREGGRKRGGTCVGHGAPIIPRYRTGQLDGASPGSVPSTIGTRTAAPHSVQDPS